MVMPGGSTLSESDRRVFDSLQERVEDQRLELEKKNNKIAALQRNFENMSKSCLDTSGEVCTHCSSSHAQCIAFLQTKDLQKRYQQVARELADVTKELHAKVKMLLLLE